MYGTVAYFTDYFKANIMNNFVAEQVSPIQASYQQMKEKIDTCEASEEDKQVYLLNFERAFKTVCYEVLGKEEELHENRSYICTGT